MTINKKDYIKITVWLVGVVLPIIITLAFSQE